MLLQLSSCRDYFHPWNSQFQALKNYTCQHCKQLTSSWSRDITKINFFVPSLNIALWDIDSESSTKIRHVLTYKLCVTYTHGPLHTKGTEIWVFWRLSQYLGYSWGSRLHNWKDLGLKRGERRKLWVGTGCQICVLAVKMFLAFCTLQNCQMSREDVVCLWKHKISHNCCYTRQLSSNFLASQISLKHSFLHVLLLLSTFWF